MSYGMFKFVMIIIKRFLALLATSLQSPPSECLRYDTKLHFQS